MEPSHEPFSTKNIACYTHPLHERLNAVCIHLVANNRVRAIKEIRLLYGLHLRDAKDIMDALVQMFPETFSDTYGLFVNIRKYLPDNKYPIATFFDLRDWNMTICAELASYIKSCVEEYEGERGGSMIHNMRRTASMTTKEWTDRMDAMCTPGYDVVTRDEMLVLLAMANVQVTGKDWETSDENENMTICADDFLSNKLMLYDHDTGRYYGWITDLPMYTREAAADILVDVAQRRER